MIIVKPIFYLIVTMSTFAVGTAFAAVYTTFATQPVVSAELLGERPTPLTTKPLSGIYFVAPSSQVSGYQALNCNEDNGRVYTTGGTQVLTYQIPRIRRLMRDGRWLFFETEESAGTSYQFFGILPESLNTDQVRVSGKLISIINGHITSSADAEYSVAGCSLR
jgi:hypothetical protein